MFSYWTALCRSTCRQRLRDDTLLTPTQALFWLNQSDASVERRKKFCLHFCPFECLSVRVIMLVSAFVCARMCAQEAACIRQAAWATLEPLKGFNYPALFLAWDTILSPDKAETRQGLWNHCEQLFSLCQTNGRQGFMCRRGFRRTCWGPFHFHSSGVDLQQNTNVYDPKCAQENHFILDFLS